MLYNVCILYRVYPVYKVLSNPVELGIVTEGKDKMGKLVKAPVPAYKERWGLVSYDPDQLIECKN